MASFQEFATKSERRRDDLDNGRRRIRVGATVASVVLLLAVVGAVCTLYSPATEPKSTSAASSSGAGLLHSTARSVQMLCESTDYRETCVSSLNKVVAKNTTDPKELVKAAVAVVLEEFAAAFSRTRQLAGGDPKVRGALEDCRQLFEDSKDELKRSLDAIVAGGIERIRENSRDIRAWLSSVMSYQQTCIDGFPEGELKTKLQKLLNKARELTSNSLAIVGELANFLEMLDVPENEQLHAGTRKLLAEIKNAHQLDEEGFPSWVPEESRRVLNQINIKLKPNVTVAKDGTGDYKTISEALEKIPANYAGRYVVYVKEGVYDETVNVTKKMANVTMVGDGGNKTIITGDKNFVDGVRTFLTATFVASGDNFMGIGLGIRNTAGAAKHQAVAIRVQSDRSVFFECRFEGYQDTLYAQAKRQFYRSCVVAGTVDFIFGDSSAVFQNCLLVVRRPLDNQQNIVLAHGRTDRHETTGFVLHKCKIFADDKLVPAQAKIRSYLGRPWKEFARHVIMESEIGGAIHPDGYMPWEGDFGLKTLFYGEFNNMGDGAGFAGRVKWPGVRQLKKTTAQRFAVANFIQGNQWINEKRGVIIPVRYGLYN
ncbi:Putative pectinesterase/pectinesterase inhibitor 45 [Apostasia shenzhenica]|uniref:Pectinesterase n=1 Tax=Apostasia shenzhenica TaxID=1088818 RepID=A0A2I0B2X5_9ASPA|nr:Putative pectinesterase/pectinesterase inhibitor 45 [Apostasia shenzhenica]